MNIFQNLIVLSNIIFFIYCQEGQENTCMLTQYAPVNVNNINNYIFILIYFYLIAFSQSKKML